MSIERVTDRPVLVWLTCLLLGLGQATAGRSEEGQYRSKIRIDSGNELARGAAISIEELERQMGSIADPYAKSSAGRHLARHYVEAEQFDKAIEYYQTALRSKGLDDIANREMLRELAQVYLLSKDYDAAATTLERALEIDLIPDAVDYLLLAQAYYRRGKLLQVVKTLDMIGEQGLTLNIAQQRQALALYYQAGAYAQCEQLLRQLLDAEPGNPESWHQLASVYLQQGKRKQALDQLALAWEKAIPFDEQDIRLLADLQAVNGNPYGGASILDGALAANKVERTAANYRKLFEFWLQAREQDRAADALAQAASRSGDTELYLYLAQLRMEQEDWQAMHQTMLAACAKQLQDKYVGRANLLLGISQLKLGDDKAARRSFINATLIGGATSQAGQWLDYMNAEPATKRETLRIEGVCYGARDKRTSAAAMSAGTGAPENAIGQGGGAGDDAAVQTKTVDALRFFYQDFSGSLAELAVEAKNLAIRMSVILIKSGGATDGPLHIISTGEPGADHMLQLAIPVKGAPRASGRYRIRQAAAFRCAYLVLEGPLDSLEEIWSNFTRAILDDGYELTDERRLVFGSDSGGGVKLELQIGIR
jgi:tetratricopeptide (TPR) repeat protein